MRAGHAGRAGLGVALCALAAGCRTPGPAAPVLPDIENAPLPPLSAAAEARAGALSHFAQGLLDEQYRRYESALSNYTAAAALDPDEDDLRLRMALGLLHQRRADEAVGVMEGLYRRRPRSERVLRWTALVNRAADRMDRVEGLYREMIKLKPSAPEAYLELAALLVRQDRAAEAQELLEKAVGAVDDPLDILRLLAGLHAQNADDATTAAEEQASRQAAIAALERAQAAAPEDVSLLFQLGDLYIADGAFEKAVACFEAIEAQSPDNLVIKQKLALSLLAVGDKQKAIAALEDLSRRQPENPRLYYYLGELYQEQGELEKALFQFVLAEKAAPDDPTPFLKRALVQLEDLKQPETAVETLREGMKKLPDDPRLVEMLAYLHYGQKQYEQALAYFRQLGERAEAGKAAATSPMFHLHYALAAQAMDRMEEAASSLQKAVGRNPAYLEAYLHHAFRQTRDEDVARSAALLDRLCRAESADPGLYYSLGLLRSYLHEYPAAMAAFEAAERLATEDPDQDTTLDARFYFWYGAAAERSGERDRAERLMARCLELDPDHADAYNYLAYMWAEKGQNLEQAMEYIRKALGFKPDSAAFIDTLGWVYFMQGDYPAALEQLTRAAGLLPDDPTILDHLGDAQFKLGALEQALEQWKQAFRLDPEHNGLGDKLREHGVDLAPLREEAGKLKAMREAEANKAEPETGVEDEIEP